MFFVDVRSECATSVRVRDLPEKKERKSKSVRKSRGDNVRRVIRAGRNAGFDEPRTVIPDVASPKIVSSQRTRDQLRDDEESHADGKLLTKRQKRELLYRLAHSTRALPGERIKAIEVDNRMSGDNEPDRVAVNVSDGFWDFAAKQEGGRA